MSSLNDLSWRRFLVLVRGLSPNSATVAKLSARRYMGGGHKEQVVEVTTPEAASRVFAALFGPPKSTRPD